MSVTPKLFILLLALNMSEHSWGREQNFAHKNQVFVDSVRSPFPHEPNEIWQLKGDNSKSYTINIERIGDEELYPVCLRSIEANPRGFGAISKKSTIAAKQFSGKKIRLTALIKTSRVRDWAGLWMRVDAQGRRGVSFDNMENRPINGTTEWKEYSIVLKIPTYATSISYGLLLNGPGEAWINKIAVEIVGDDVHTTP